MMKRFVFIVLSFVAVFFASCKKSNVVSPSIEIGGIRVNGKMMEKNIVHVGDTIQFYMVLQPYYDRLVYIQSYMNRSYFKDSTFSDDDFLMFCNVPASNKEKGYYVFKDLGDGVGVYLNPACVVVIDAPDEESNLLNITYELKSTADVMSEYNPTYQRFRFTVLKKEEE